jgi:cation:H+ antiporter
VSSFLVLLAGIVLLIGGGTALVAGASQLAARLGVAPLIIGLTIVGFGTSSPELIVNVIGALEGETGLAFGNVVGSNIANLGLVLGLSAMFRPVDIESSVVRREVPLLLLVTSVITVMALDGLIDGSTPVISRSDALVLLLMFGIFVYLTVQDVLLARRRDPLLTEIEDNPIIVTHPVSPRVSRACGLWIILGFALLFFGGDLTVKSGVALATELGISSTLVGLFVVAVGTSMPELVTSVIASVRKESDLAIGSLVGSNIFNSLIVLPASCIAGPVLVPQGGVLDLAFTWLLAALLIPVFFIGQARMSRLTGGVLLLAYLGYGWFRLTGG